MRLSQRIGAIIDGGGDGWGILHRARSMQAAGEAVINLSIGDHDFGTPDAFIDVMENSARRGNVGYSPIAGQPVLRGAIAKRVKNLCGLETSPANIIVTAGGQAAMFYAFTTISDPGDEIIVIDPFYATYLPTVRAVGASPVVVEARAENLFQPDVGKIEQAISAKTKGLLINSPHNPTGVIYTPQTMHSIAELCRRHDIWLISDEVYNTHVHDGSHLFARALPDMADRTITIGSMSKSHAMTGWRMGWIEAPAAVVEAATNLALTVAYGLPGFLQEAAAFALTNGEDQEREIAARYKLRRDIVVDALAGSNALSIIKPEGGMFVMADIRASAMTGQAFANQLLDQEKIAVMPGESFGNAAAGHIRIALTVNEEELRRAAETIAGFAARRMQEAA